MLAIPLSLYIHFPWCIRKCPYCDFNSYALKNTISVDLYVKQLIADLANDLVKIKRPHLQSIFFGGGTPSLMVPETLEAIINTVAKHCSFADDIEITLEANPGTFDKQKCQRFFKAGINRLSIGVQSFNEKYLGNLGRIYGVAEVHSAIKAAYSAGFTNINFDLMFGVPQQSIQDALYDLKCALSYEPAHISWYQLTIEPNTKYFISQPKLPTHDETWEMQQQGQTLLADIGYERYEVSAFSKKMQCKHNLNYWEFGDYLGIGAGAHSKLTIDNRCVRSYKIYDPYSYLQKQGSFIVENKLISQANLPFEFMMNALRLYKPIPFALFEERTRCQIAVIKEVLTKAQDLGFIKLASDFLETTKLGKNFLNNLLELFL